MSFTVIEQKVNYKGLVNSLDIKPNEYLLPLYEVVVNSIQSLEDNIKEKNKSIIIVIHKEKLGHLGYEEIDDNYSGILGFTVSDNGVGFTDKRQTAFSTPYTNFNAEKGGKGMGRYTVLACFESLEIESEFLQEDKFYKRKYKFDNVVGLQKEDDIIGEVLKNNNTIVKLNNYRPDFFSYIKKNRIDINHVSDGIIQHCLLYFINDDCPTIRVLYDDQNIEDALVLNDIYKSVIKFESEPQKIKLENTNIEDEFTISYIKNFNGVQSHYLHLCANKRQVGERYSLSSYIPSFKVLFEKDKRYHLSIYVESEFLNRKNNPQRNKFGFPDKDDKKNSFDEISLDGLFNALSQKIRTDYRDYIEEAEKEKSERIEKYILNPQKPRLRYRHLLGVDNIFDDIPINASDDTLEARLHEKEFKLEQKREKLFNRVFNKKKYDKEEFGSIVQEILKEEAAFSKDKLADLMIKRKSVIKLFQKYLEWRNDENFMLEEDLHNIIFTMGAESDNMPIEYHNLWLLDERFTFHSYTSSDIKTKSQKQLESQGNKEPDLFIYDVPWAYSDDIDKINSLVVFEFKKPGKELSSSTNLDDLIIKYFGDLMESKARSRKGKLLNIEDNTPKFGYIICELNKDLIDRNVKWNGFKKSAFGHLYKINPELNMHIEVMTYEQMLDFAEKRHNTFFKALGIDAL